MHEHKYKKRFHENHRRLIKLIMYNSCSSKISGKKLLGLSAHLTILTISGLADPTGRYQSLEDRSTDKSQAPSRVPPISNPGRFIIFFKPITLLIISIHNFYS